MGEPSASRTAWEWPRGRGFSLIELLCVMGIIGILASLLLGAAGRAYQRAKRFGNEMDGPAYIDELRAKLIVYVSANPRFTNLPLNTLIERCRLSSRTAAFLRSREVAYFPFSGSDPDDTIVIVHVIGQGRTAQPAAYLKGWLCNPDPPE